MDSVNAWPMGGAWVSSGLGLCYCAGVSRLMMPGAGMVPGSHSRYGQDWPLLESAHVQDRRGPMSGRPWYLCPSSGAPPGPLHPLPPEFGGEEDSRREGLVPQPRKSHQEAAAG